MQERGLVDLLLGVPMETAGVMTMQTMGRLAPVHRARGVEHHLGAGRTACLPPIIPARHPFTALP